MTREFWKKFEDRYPTDYLQLLEILPADKVQRLIKMDSETHGKQLYFLHNWLASFFRDAIAYGYELGYRDGRMSRQHRYGAD